MRFLNLSVSSSTSQRFIGRPRLLLRLASASTSQLISMAGFVLTLLALTAALLGSWRFSAGLGWTSQFVIDAGLWSRYQLWFAIAICAHVVSVLLGRELSHRQLVLVETTKRAAGFGSRGSSPLVDRSGQE